ncbi:MAG: TIR domain-containing protein [Burkholderiaceae bacterium]
MPDDALDRLRQACVYIRSPDGSSGSGYLIAPQRVGTAEHVVRSWQPGQGYDVLVGTGADRRTCKARLLKSDPARDAAVLTLDEALPATPLPVAKRLDRKSSWDAYGFPALANQGDDPPGLPIDGHVQDPATSTDGKQPAVLLYSEMIAAGSASPLHGFSGSPVLVDGALIGHLIKHVGDVDDRRRAAYGYVYACPIDVVLALLDVEPQRQAIQPEPIRTITEAIPEIGADEYHVFVSYRSTDRAWALSLVARLEGAGLRVFIDQRELQVGEYLAGQLQSALQRSRAAVLLVSRGWIESPWCQQEANILVKRAVEDGRFRLLPLRLDDSVMPPLLDSRVWLDFNGTKRAEGELVQRLLNSLIARQAPPAGSASARAETADREVTDEFVSRLRGAAMTDARRVLDVLDEWRKTASTDEAPLIAAADTLIGLGAFGPALDVLDSAPPALLRVRQLRALAMSKNGDNHGAVEILEALQREGHLDAESAGLLAGRYKAHWLETGDESFRQRAYELYLDAYQRTGDSFNGINAASIALQREDLASMYKLAGEVIEALRKRPVADLDEWDLATLGEGYLLLQRFDDARDWYGRAVAKAAGRHQSIAIMRLQARRNLRALKQPQDRLDRTLPVPRVLAYCGHMVDAVGRAKPRFPREKVPAVRNAIRDRLEQLGALHGFGSAACGTDLLFLEELTKLGRSATVLLPFPEKDFADISIGRDWSHRWAKVRDARNIEVLQPLQPARPPADELSEAFSIANREILRRAIEYAKRLDERPIVIAVWDGRPGDGAGGTAETVALWRDEGYEVEVIDITRL